MEIARGCFYRTTALLITLACGGLAGVHQTAHAAEPPVPLLAKGKPVDWWFVFKLNSRFAGCGGEQENPIRRVCPFGGRVQDYKNFGQQFISASSSEGSLKKGVGCVGQSADDPVGATFDQIYNGRYFFVIWNDDFHGSPAIKGCGSGCGAPWGHSKGMLAWDDSGQGLVLQVTTPSWPAAGSKRNPRKSEGNTLGCLKHNNVLVSQHFFALKLTKQDLVTVLDALENASIPTDPNNPQLVNNGGPQEIQDRVDKLGKKSTSTTHTKIELSSKVTLISKPSRLHVPPWQLVSAVVDRSSGQGLPLRAATWWANPKIYTTTRSQKVTCWADELDSPGPVQVALTGQWDGREFGLAGVPSANFNHAKIGVSREGDHYVIFGDMNQQGSARTPNCKSSQNGRGGLFYVVKDRALHDSVKELIEGATAPTRAPAQ